MNMQVRSLALLSGLRIQRCHCCGTGLIPGPVTSSCHRHGKKKKKRKERKGRKGKEKRKEKRKEERTVAIRGKRLLQRENNPAIELEASQKPGRGGNFLLWQRVIEARKNAV